jgi:ABC-2 type transport system permease protein
MTQRPRGIGRPVWAVAFRDYRIRLTNPVLPLWDILVPAVYLVVFGGSMQQWLGPELRQLDYPLFLIGAVVAMVTFSIAMNSSYAFFEDLQSGIFHELLTYPFARRDLLLGKLVFNGLFSLFGVLVCLLAGRFALGQQVDWIRWPGLLAAAFLGTAGWYFFYTWLALRARGFNAYHTTSSALYLLLMFVSNLFYPASELPGWIRWLAYCNPVTWQVDVLRYLSGAMSAPSFALYLEGIGYLLFTAFWFFLADRSLNGPIE